jgi:hypothetical protein
VEDRTLSYDLMVFDPDAAPTDRDAFLAWVDSQSDDVELFDPTRSEFSTRNLRLWLEEMLKTFPAMNGPYVTADQDGDDLHVTDYDISRTNIYACFAWPLAEESYLAVMSLAEKYGIGVYDISDPEGTIWRPGSDGLLC